MLCALIDEATGKVVNVLVASPTDTVSKGLALVLVDEIDGASTIDQRWEWSREKGFYPNAALQAEKDAEAARLAAEAAELAAPP